MNVRVKVCGVTTPTDALAAVEAGADAIGLLFFAGSRRHVSFRTASGIVSELPRTVAVVGVLVNPTTDDLRRAAEEVGLDAVQLHGDETPEFVSSLVLPARRTSGLTGFLPPAEVAASSRLGVIKAFRVRDASTLSELPRYETDLWLLDSFAPDKMGGTGTAFAWNLAAEANKLGRPIVLAGGLTPHNVAEAVRTVHPHAVDVSTGVESSPGRKDRRLLQAFIEAARSVG